MRMRKRPNTKPRMERCESVWIKEPKELQGKWIETLMPEAKELHVEVGCGKGKFTVETAKQNPDVLLVAIEKVPDALVVAMELARNEGVKNVFFISEDATELCEIFGYGEVDRIYLNFCDPWPRKKNAKRRLTYRTFLTKYAWMLREQGEIHFKTDNAKLFEFSLEEFAETHYELRNVTRNLHENGPVGIMTGYEERFYELGTPINRCEAIPTRRPAEADKPVDPVWERPEADTAQSKDDEDDAE